MARAHELDLHVGDAVASSHALADPGARLGLVAVDVAEAEVAALDGVVTGVDAEATAVVALAVELGDERRGLHGA